MTLQKKLSCDDIGFKKVCTEEKVMLYFLMNFILKSQFKIADKIILNLYLAMKKCSNLFKGNIRYMQALSSH